MTRTSDLGILSGPLGLDAPDDVRGARRSSASPADDLAARFFETLSLLARFGLASHTRLLEAAPRDG